MKNPASNPMHPEKRHFHGDNWCSGQGRAEAMAGEALADDIARFYASEAGREALLNEALAIGDTGAIAGALGLIARARGMSGLAADIGVKRQQLYRALSEDGNPTLETLTRVMKALGYRLSVEREPGEREQAGAA